MELLCCEDAFNRARPDPTLLVDSRIIEHLLAAESRYQPSCSCLHSMMTDIKPYMRREVATWMLEVCEEQGCEEVVFPLAVNIMDRFLSRVHVRKSQLQLLGAVCLLVASKFRQWRAFTADQLSYYTDHSVTAHDITNWELLVVGRLRWDVGGVVASDYLDYVLHRLTGVTCVTRVRQHAITFISLCAIEHKFIIYPPSLVAAASLAAAIQGLRCHGCNSFDHLALQLQQILNIDKSLLQSCMNEIEELVASSVKSLEQQQLQQQQQNAAAAPGKTPASNTPSLNNKMPTSALHDAAQPETPTDIQDIYF